MFVLIRLLFAYQLSDTNQRPISPCESKELMKSTLTEITRGTSSLGADEAFNIPRDKQRQMQLGH